jgi:UDP-glucose 4-epimerase
MKKNTILILGATGTVGAYTAVELSKDYHVIAAGKRKSDNGFFIDYGIDYFTVDITCKDDLKKLPIENIDAIVHCAGIMPARMQGYYPHVYIDSEIHGTLNVLEYMVDMSINKIVFTQAGNNNVYQLGKIPVPADIQKVFPLNSDHSVYSICKNAAVDLIEHFHYKHAIKRFILRLCNIYHYHPDPYYYVNGEKRMIGHRLIMDKAMKGEDIEIWGDPSKAKEIVYVYDCVSIIKKALESDLEGGVYNIGGHAPITLEEQIRGIVDVFCPQDKKVKITYCPDKLNEREFAADITKTRRELGYTPEWTYLRGLIDMKEKMFSTHFSKLWGIPADYI